VFVQFKSVSAASVSLVRCKPEAHCPSVPQGVPAVSQYASGGAPVFTASDCAFLEEFAGGTQTGDLTEEQISGIADLRARLLEAATAVADQLSADWRPFRSEVNRSSISGHVAKFLWSCAYPSASPHKSFGLQVALIVQSSGIELCFCLSAGVSQSKSGDTRDELGREFARVRERMQTAPRGVIEGVSQRLESEWSFRSRQR
jgi:hypothetical protein